jgi:tetrathionate reductase subunit A
MSNSHTLMTRRNFFKTSALLGGTVLGANAFEQVTSTGFGREKVHYPLNDSDNVIYSVCLNCRTDCPIKVKIEDGVAVKIDGNPYSIQNLNTPIPTSTNIDVAAKIDGGLCPKGQSGVQVQYDPYRIVKVLKRAGKRGENRWKEIPYEKAIEEIVEGGKLFADVAGEKNRVIEGLRAVRALSDANVAKAMAADAMDVGKGKMELAIFKEKYKEHLHTLIDPDMPDLGPKNNQFFMMAGRMEEGRKDFAKRWQFDAYGSPNWIEHTTVCEQSHHIAFKKITSQYELDEKEQKWKWKPATGHMKPDFRNSKFVIFFGTGAVEANFGPPIMANLMTNAIVDEGCKIAVVDPRMSKTAAKAWKWIPIRPGGDAAYAYGIIHWMFENNKINEAFLKNANKAAAKANNESSWTSATHLVRIEEDGPGKKLRASDIGMGSDYKFVAISNGKPVAVDANSEKDAVVGELFYEGEIAGIKVKTELSLIKEYALSKSIDEWAKEAGLDAEHVVTIAKEFTKHGRQAVAEMYRGVVQHTNGTYNGMSIIYLNMLIGNIDYNGGLIKGGGGFHIDGAKGGPFNFHKEDFEGKTKSFGHMLTKEGSHYENSSWFKKEGYPAKRPWYPHTSDVYQEVLTSAEDGYPYKIKILMTIMGTPILALPGGDKSIPTLLSLEKVPLYIANDVTIGETSMYADYIFPDFAIWERWGTPGTTPVAVTKMSKVRQPTVEPMTEEVTVFGEKQHAGFETMLLAIAERMKLPGHGKNGLGEGKPLTRPEHFYLKLVANMAFGENEGENLPEASAKEIETFKKARRHLSPLVYDYKRWEEASLDANGVNHFKRVVYMLNRGVRGEDFTNYINNVNSSDKILHKFGKMLNFYSESIATSHHSFSGKRFVGYARYNQAVDYAGKQIVPDGSNTLRLITYKPITGGQSRTQGPAYWLQAIMPENAIVINSQTAAKLGLQNGDKARIVSASNPKGEWDLGNGQTKSMIGTVEVVQGLRPDVVNVSWSFGHWAYGSRDFTINKEIIKGEKARGAGLCPNAAMAIDSKLTKTTLADPIGGSAVFYDSYVGLVKV